MEGEESRLDESRAAKRTLEFNPELGAYEQYQIPQAELTAEAEEASDVPFIVPIEPIPVEPVPIIPAVSDGEESLEESSEASEASEDPLPLLFDSGVASTDDLNQYFYDNHSVLDSFYSKEDLVNNPWIELASSDQQDDFDTVGHRFVNNITGNYQTAGWDLLFVKPDPTTYEPSQWVILQGSKLNEHSNSGWQNYTVKSLGFLWEGATRLHLYRKTPLDQEPVVLVNNSSAPGDWGTNAIYYDSGGQVFNGLRCVYYRAHDYGAGQNWNP